MTLKTRKPTGAVPWPLILLEGGEKVGKGWACAVLSASPKVGQTVVLDLNEGAWDEYGLIPGARFEIAEHDGTWASIYSAVTDAKEEAAADAAAGRPPFVLVVDGETAIWEGLKDWGAVRARSSRANRAKLDKDPNAEVTIPMNIWNDVNARHRRLMNVLMTFPGIVIMTARGGHVAAVENGQPVEGKKTYRVEGNKSIGYDVTVWVRLSRDDKPVVVGARSVHAGVRPGIDPAKTLPDDWTLEWLIFDALKCDPKKAHVRDVVEMRPDAMTPEQIRDEAIHPKTDVDRMKEMYRLAKQSGYDDVTVLNEAGAEELLITLLSRIGKERGGAAPQKPRAVPSAPDAGLEPEDPWAAKVEGLASTEEASETLGEVLTLVNSQGISADRADQVTAAILARFPQAAPSAGAEDPEARWAQDFRARLDKAGSEAMLLGMRTELTRAVTGKKVSPETANGLIAALNERRTQFAKEAA